MSWWNIDGRSDDILGDRPADIMGDALSEIAYFYRQADKPLPTLQELLDPFAVAIVTCPACIEDAERIVGGGIKAFLESGETVDARASGGAADETSVKVFCRAFMEIAAEYQNHCERIPRIRELLETLLFVLRPALRRYLRDSEDMVISMLVAEGENERGSI